MAQSTSTAQADAFEERTRKKSRPAPLRMTVLNEFLCVLWASASVFSVLRLFYLNLCLFFSFPLSAVNSSIPLSGPTTMLDKKLNTTQLLWIQFEDVLAPRLGLTVKERAVYSYLLRHSLVVGKLRVQFAVISLARTLRLSIGAARHAVRRLDELEALRVLKRDKTGHHVEMRLPEKIRALRQGKNGASIAMGVGATGAADAPSASALEATDFMKSWALRKAIHDRERGTCFYCLRRTLANVRCLDHVVPRVRFGRNSYRNLVSCCLECNTRKVDRAAPDFMRTLYRMGRLTPAELDAGLRALKDLAAGQLRPVLPSA